MDLLTLPRIPRRCTSGILKNDKELTGDNLDKTLRQGNHLGKTQKQTAFKEQMLLYDSCLGLGEEEGEEQQDTKLKRELRIRQRKRIPIRPHPRGLILPRLGGTISLESTHLASVTGQMSALNTQQQRKKVG